jgi:hypothetical protein
VKESERGDGKRERPNEHVVVPSKAQNTLRPNPAQVEEVEYVMHDGFI